MHVVDFASQTRLNLLKLGADAQLDSQGLERINIFETFLLRHPLLFDAIKVTAEGTNMEKKLVTVLVYVGGGCYGRVQDRPLGL